MHNLYFSLHHRQNVTDHFNSWFSQKLQVSFHVKRRQLIVRFNFRAIHSIIFYFIESIPMKNYSIVKLKIQRSILDRSMVRFWWLDRNQHFKIGLMK